MSRADTRQGVGTASAFIDQANLPSLSGLQYKGTCK